jgi:TonB family protein
VFILAVLGLFAVASPADTALRVPGTLLRFGLTDTLASARGFPPAGGGTRQGRCRFFGLVSQATLGFTDGRLARVRFSVTSASPYEVAYIEDQLTAMGYKRRCKTRSPAESVCDWTGRASVHLEVRDTSLTATVVPAGTETMGPGAPPAPGAQDRAEPTGAGPLPVPPVTLAAPLPMLPETLAVPLPNRASRYAAARVVGEARAPVYPAVALRTGIQGRVWLIALVDTSGRVIEANVTRGIPELNDAALEAVRLWRFEPRTLQGTPCRFRVLLSVPFTLH